MPQRKILPSAEREAFEAPPVFDSHERKRFFYLPLRIQELVEQLRTPTNKVYFVLTFGYFRASQKFFPGQFYRKDLTFVARKLGVSVTQVSPTSYDHATSGRHQRLLLEFFGVRAFDQTVCDELQRDIQPMIRAQTRPKLMFWHMIDLLKRRRIEIPSYATLSALIIDAINAHRRALSTLIEHHLSPECRQVLDSLFEKGDQSDNQKYLLTLLKKINQSTRPSKIQRMIQDLSLLHTLFTQVEEIMTRLDLPDEGIRYYATFVMKAEIFQISRRTDEYKYLHVMAFVMYQYFRMHDAVIDIFLTYTQQVMSRTTRTQKERYYDDKDRRNASMTDLLGCVEHHRVLLAKIQEVVQASGMDDHEKLHRIQDILSDEHTRAPALQEKLAQYTREAASTADNLDFYTCLEAHSLKMQTRLSGIVKQIEFHHTSGRELMKAITYYKTHDGNLDKHTPLGFLRDSEQTLVIDQKNTLRVSLYKALLFLHLADALKNGSVNLKHSYKYRPFDEYLIPQETWNLNKEDYLQRADLEPFRDCETVLKTLNTALEAQYQHTNQHISQHRFSRSKLTLIN